MQWVIDADNLVYASLLLTGGTLGVLYGRRRIFALGIVLFAGGTLLCDRSSFSIGRLTCRTSPLQLQTSYSSHSGTQFAHAERHQIRLTLRMARARDHGHLISWVSFGCCDLEEPQGNKIC
jgi:hypothetical protein